MQRYIWPLAFLSLLVGLSALGIDGAKADKVGVASVVVNQVQGIVGGNSRSLFVGSDVFANENIRTSDASTAQLLFLDKTSLTIGPRADLRLDRFVYDPQRGVGQVVIDATQGAFRFITGSQNPTSYRIKTPVAAVGIRGTILDLLITGNATSGYTLTVVLDECCAIITLPSGKQLNLTQPGTAYVLTSAGGITGPVPWDGTIVDAGGGLSFPLYGWYFKGEPPPNGLPSTQLGNIDQLNAVIAGQLESIKGGGSGGGRGGTFSDIRLKRDIARLKCLDSGICIYRFRYTWSNTFYVGVMAQEVERIVPGAVVRGSDGYLRVYYDRLGMKFETWDEWIKRADEEVPAFAILRR